MILGKNFERIHIHTLTHSHTMLPPRSAARIHNTIMILSFFNERIPHAASSAAPPRKSKEPHGDRTERKERRHALFRLKLRLYRNHPSRKLPYYLSQRTISARDEGKATHIHTIIRHPSTISHSLSPSDILSQLVSINCFGNFFHSQFQNHFVLTPFTRIRIRIQAESLSLSLSSSFHTRRPRG